MIMSGYSIVIIAKSSRDVNMEDIIMAEKTNANIGFEKQLWDAACVLWGHIPAAEYRKVIVGLIFLRYISAAFDKRYKNLLMKVTVLKMIVMRMKWTMYFLSRKKHAGIISHIRHIRRKSAQSLIMR